MRFAKVEVQVTAAMVTALASLSTAEWVDLSSVFSGPVDQPQNPTRDVEETPVSGDASPIVSVGPNSARQFAFTMLYTEGEVLGSDNLDPYQDLFKPVMEDDAALVMPMRWTPAGSGGDIYTTSATGTFMIGLTDPVGGVTSEKIMFTVTITTETLGIT
jgi:hypothetical protein